MFICMFKNFRYRISLNPNITVTDEEANNMPESHLIIEYKARDYWATLGDPRIIRLVLHNDKDNPMLRSLDDLLADRIVTFDPNLFIISGLQAMDNYPFANGERERRLIKLRQLMISQKPSTHIHFEIANYEELNFFKELLLFTIPYVDSIGLNDHELERFSTFLQHNKITMDGNKKRPKPRVASVLDQIRSVFRQLRQRDARNRASNAQSRSITRIHVHSRAFQAIIVSRQSNWRNTKNAAAKAALTAYRTACDASITNLESAKLTMDKAFSSTAVRGVESPRRFSMNELDPVSCWAEDIPVDSKSVAVEICVAPVLVCKEPKRTTGVRDTISAAGLVLQI